MYKSGLIELFRAGNVSCPKGKKMKGWMIERMNIATLNLNGETFFSINRRPRLPESIFNIKSIKEKLSNLTKNGLNNVLAKADWDIDILAVQEFVNSKKERDEIERDIEKAGYKLMVPELNGNIHFVTGFIVRKKYIDKCTVENGPLEKELANNRKAFLKFEDDNINFSIFNVHVNNHTINIPDTSTILVGDMNACKSNQTSNQKGINEKFIEDIEHNYDAVGQEGKHYTWTSNGIEKQLDHIYLSKKYGTNNSNKISVADNVNFYYEPLEGFTDHSMLIWNFGELQEK